MSEHPGGPTTTSSRGLALLALGVVAGTVVALLAAARQRTADTARSSAELQELDLALRDEMPWVFETSVLVHRGAGEIAVHLHEHGGLPGMVTPREGPPMDQVTWLGPGGSHLRVHVHTLAGGSRSEIVLKGAPADGSRALENGLDHRLRSSLASLRSELERSR